jgi:hypothetical protein
MGVFSGDFLSVSGGLWEREESDLGGVLPDLRVQPQVRDSETQRCAARLEAGEKAEATKVQVRVAGYFGSARGLGGGRLSVVCAVEGDAAFVVALDS